MINQVMKKELERKAERDYKEEVFKLFKEEDAAFVAEMTRLAKERMNDSTNSRPA